MAITVTSIEPYAGSRGATGTLLTINGTGFEAAQGAGTLTIGAVPVIVAVWAATQITCYADDTPATPLGAQDVVVTNATGDTLTKTKAVFIYDATDNESDSEVHIGNIGKVYVDGVDIGQIQGSVDISQSRRLLPYKPSHKHHVTFERELEKNVTISFVMDQVNGENMALFSGGTFSDASDILTVTSPGTANISEHSVYLTDSAGCTYFVPRCRIPDLGSMSLAPDTWKGLPLTLMALPVDDTTSLVYQMKLPA